MPEDSLTVAGGKTGDRVRTFTKVYENLTKHEEYMIPDVPWKVQGSYFWAQTLAGMTGSGSSGMLAVLYHPVDPAAYDLVVRKISVGWMNNGAAAANTVYFTRTLAFPGSNLSDGTAGKKDSTSPVPTAWTKKNPTGVALSTADFAIAEPFLIKPSTLGAYGQEEIDFTKTDEPFVLAEDEALVVYQNAVGTTTEDWFVRFEWHEVVL